MARLHHATAKRATDAGVDMTEEDGVWTATKGDIAHTNTNPAHALDATIFHAVIAVEYPALSLRRTEQGYSVHANDALLWPEEGEYSPVPPKMADLAIITDACHEHGIDPEEGYDEAEEEQRSGSVVVPIYKQRYAELGDATNNGDWLAQTLKSLRLVVIAGKKETVDTDAYNTLFMDNGIETADFKFASAFYGTAERRNGWEGRFAMSGRNVLRKRVADNGFLMAFGDRIDAPAEFCDAHRTAPKKSRAKKAEATTSEE